MWLQPGLPLKPNMRRAAGDEEDVRNLHSRAKDSTHKILIHTTHLYGCLISAERVICYATPYHAIHTCRILLSSSWHNQITLEDNIAFLVCPVWMIAHHHCKRQRHTRKPTIKGNGIVPVILLTIRTMRNDQRQISMYDMLYIYISPEWEFRPEAKREKERKKHSKKAQKNKKLHRCATNDRTRVVINCVYWMTEAHRKMVIAPANKRITMDELKK